ncbi:MAG: hypothetical protein WCL24_06655 [Verrucomicrobiota bacterium]|nr:hypothetical protein [Opitutales bacterium]
MRLPALLLACGLLLGCSSLSTHRGDGLDRVQRIYVEHLLTDNHRLDHAMVAELRGLGYEASCGPLTMLPDNTDAILTYRERSAWDFQSYLIELSFELKGRITGQTLATGRYYQPSVHPKTPEEVVHAVLPPAFRRR